MLLCAQGQKRRLRLRSRQHQIVRPALLAAAELEAVEHLVHERGRKPRNIRRRVGLHIPDGKMLSLPAHAGVAVEFRRAGHHLAVQNGRVVRVQGKRAGCKARPQGREVQPVQLLPYPIVPVFQIHRLHLLSHSIIKSRRNFNLKSGRIFRGNRRTAPAAPPAHPAPGRAASRARAPHLR